MILAHLSIKSDNDGTSSFHVDTPVRILTSRVHLNNQSSVASLDFAGFALIVSYKSAAIAAVVAHLYFSSDSPMATKRKRDCDGHCNFAKALRGTLNALFATEVGASTAILPVLCRWTDR